MHISILQCPQSSFTALVIYSRLVQVSEIILGKKHCCSSKGDDNSAKTVKLTPFNSFPYGFYGLGFHICKCEKQNAVFFKYLFYDIQENRKSTYVEHGVQRSSLRRIKLAKTMKKIIQQKKTKTEYLSRTETHCATADGSIPHIPHTISLTILLPLTAPP